MNPPDTTDLLLLPDGRVLVHNLTPAMAKLLRDVDPLDRALAQRGTRRKRRQIRPATEPRPRRPRTS